MRTNAWRRLVVGIALLAVATHICVGSAHAELWPFPSATPVQAPAEAGHHDDGGAGALHAASCEAVSPGAVASVLVITASTWSLHLDALTRAWRPTMVPGIVAVESPPLFLLHASFLI